jgi:HPr kinase/phosphorylase
VTPSSLVVHATSVLLGAASAPFGAHGDGAVLLTGMSGAGKSDVALRLIAMGAKLIADDRTVLSVAAGRLIAGTPAAIRGRMEIRQVGIVAMAPAPPAPVILAVSLDEGRALERLPEEALYAVSPRLGPCAPVPLIRLAPFEASTPAKIAAAAAAIINGAFVAGAVPVPSGPFL